MVNWYIIRSHWVVIILLVFWRDSKNGNFNSCNDLRHCRKFGGTGLIKNRVIPVLFQDEVCYHCQGSGIEEE